MECQCEKDNSDDAVTGESDSSNGLLKTVKMPLQPRNFCYIWWTVMFLGGPLVNSTSIHTHKALNCCVFMGLKVFRSAFHIWVKGKPHDKHCITAMLMWCFPSSTLFRLLAEQQQCPDGSVYSGGVSSVQIFSKLVSHRHPDTPCTSHTVTLMWIWNRKNLLEFTQRGFDEWRTPGGVIRSVDSSTAATSFNF